MELAVGELDDVMDARDDGRVAPGEWEQLRALDFLFRGRLGRGTDGPEALVALQVSVTVDAEDVSRARQRADVLERSGYRTIAAAGGRRATADGHAAAQDMGVYLVLDQSGEEQPLA